MSVPRETGDLLELFRTRLVAANLTQNLISPSTVGEVDTRHIGDSLQLVDLLPPDARSLLDVGSGAGLPGFVLACATTLNVLLVEPRRLRAAFLQETIDALALADRVKVAQMRVEQLKPQPFDVITARAVAPLDKLFAMIAPLSGPATRWLLPKGRSAAAEVAEAGRRWSAETRLVPSRTDPEAAIVVVDGQPRERHA